MKISAFSAGRYVRRYQYSSFEPNTIDIAWQIDDPQLDYLLSQADIRLGELNAYSQLIPNVDFFIKMHVLKEGTSSSRIEGTQTNIEEAVQSEPCILPEKRDDWREVQNYVSAMNESIENLKTLPLSNRLLRMAHRTLLHGVRGSGKEPGEFRRSQNWVGGKSLSDAVYIPPHHESISGLMSDLEKFLNNPTLPVPALIKIGIAHYQFETIHPFLDGNGRIGRLMITLFLVSNQLLNKPTLYLSDYFEHNRSFYYEKLMRVRTANDLNGWLKFFLEGVRQTASHSIQCFRKIIALRTEVENKINSLGKKRAMALTFLQYLYGKPIVDTNEMSKILAVNFSTAARLIRDFVNLNILRETTGYKRNRIFVFDAYLELFKS